MGVIQKGLCSSLGLSALSPSSLYTYKTKTSHYRWKQKYKTNDSKKQTEWKRPVGPASPIRRRRGRGRVCGVREGLVRGGGGERGHFKREADRLALRAGVWWECDRSESPGRGAALRPLRMLYRSHKREDRVKTFPQLSHPQNILSVTGRSHNYYITGGCQWLCSTGSALINQMRKNKSVHGYYDYYGNQHQKQVFHWVLCKNCHTIRQHQSLSLSSYNF